MKITYLKGLDFLKIYDIDQETLNNYKFPTNLSKLCIVDSNIDELIIPDGCEWAVCKNLGLKKIFIPDSLRTLHCQNNLLEELELPNGFREVLANNNYLKNIKIRGDFVSHICFFIDVRNNQLNNLDFMDKFIIPYFNLTDDEYENHTVDGVRAKQKIYVYNNPLLNRDKYCRDYQKLLRFNEYPIHKDYSPFIDPSVIDNNLDEIEEQYYEGDDEDVSGEI